MRYALFAVAATVTGCAGTSIPADPTKMSAEQITALAKDRNANIACSTYKGLYGTGVVNYVVLDKDVVINGVVTVDAECKVTITNGPKQ